MKDKIKAIFFDVDGTLYSHRFHDIPESTKETMIKLKQQGYKIGISTSRCRYETKNLPRFFREFPFDAAFYDGGALVMEKDHVIHKSPIDEQALEKLLHMAKQEQIPLRYSTIEGDHFAYPCDWQIKDNFFKLYLNMPNVKPYDGEEVFNILAYPKTKEHLDQIHAMHQEVNIVEHGNKTMEITAQHIDKSKGVAIMADRWNLSMEEIACFGDGYNDIEMIKHAGLGIAMGNGKDALKEVADIVCDAIDDDGIYKICRKLQFI